MSTIDLIRKQPNWHGTFKAMASPCEVIIESDNEQLAETITRTVATEAWRIEHKFSRYRDDNIIYRINSSNGARIEVDDETAGLLDFAAQLYELSDSMFDITSGVLRRVWTFDQSDRLPSQNQIDALLPLTGWHRVCWNPPWLKMQPGMEIDLGGLGKEYAVDRCARLVDKRYEISALVNFGGDLSITRPRRDGNLWTIGRVSRDCNAAVSLIELVDGALATSGDQHRYLLKDGRRYSHVLNPVTGWPVEDPPHTVSVAAPTCIEAGMLSTFALLHGNEAGKFLEAQNVRYWIN